MRFLGRAVVTLIALLPADPAWSQPAVGLTPPVDAAVERRFDEPEGTFGPGHRGIDFAVAAGRRVRASAAGAVTFAGEVAGELAVSVRHSGGLVTTYSRLSEVWVARGDAVTGGTWLGLTGEAHPGVGGLHFGVKLHGVYVDPADFIAQLDLGSAVHLTPLLWEPSDEIPEALASALAPKGPGSQETGCVDVTTRSAIDRPPNRNIVVAVAGISSKTHGADAADMYHPGPTFFGYTPGQTYLFSYRGVRGPRLHEDYERTDTYGDIEGAARRLGELVSAIGRRHPGAKVDLIAHSQGGIVARTYLTRRAQGRAIGGPPVEHLVTFASPHGGAPGAANVRHLQNETVSGPPVLAFASDRARAGWPLPDPLSPSVAQLAPGSELMSSLATQDVTFGTRVLTLGIPNDLIVPANHTSMATGIHRIVPPRGEVRLPGGGVFPGNGHSAIVTSPVARTLVHDFLRGAPEACSTVWDPLGRSAGRVVSWAQGHIGSLVSQAEGPLGRVLRTVRDLTGGERRREK